MFAPAKQHLTQLTFQRSIKFPLLYLSGTSRASQKTAISGSCQQALVGICNRVWVWWWFMGRMPRWDSLWMVIPSVSAPYFVSLTPSMGILFPLLRRIELSTLWSSFLNLMFFVNCIFHIPSFWAYIHLPVSAYHGMISSRSIHLLKNLINSLFLIAE